MLTPWWFKAEGYQEGGDVEPVAKKTMPLLDLGGQEMDLREKVVL